MPQLLTIRDVAGILKVSERTVQRLPLRFVRVGKSRRYELGVVEKYIERNASRKAA